MKLQVVPGTFAVCRLPVGTSWNPPASATFFAMTRTEDELSIVCGEGDVPVGATVEGGWWCFRVAGAIPFETVGVLASLSKTLADAEISVFAVSTFDTDYLMTKVENRDAAILALNAGGFEFA